MWDILQDNWSDLYKLLFFEGGARGEEEKKKKERQRQRERQTGPELDT